MINRKCPQCGSTNTTRLSMYLSRNKKAGKSNIGCLFPFLILLFSPGLCLVVGGVGAVGIAALAAQYWYLLLLWLIFSVAGGVFNYYFFICENCGKRFIPKNDDKRGQLGTGKEPSLNNKGRRNDLTMTVGFAAALIVMCALIYKMCGEDPENKAPYGTSGNSVLVQCADGDSTYIKQTCAKNNVGKFFNFKGTIKNIESAHTLMVEVESGNNATVEFESSVGDALHNGDEIYFYGQYVSVGTGIVTRHEIKFAKMGNVSSHDITNWQNKYGIPDSVLEQANGSKILQTCADGETPEIKKRCVDENLGKYHNFVGTVERVTGEKSIHVKVGEGNYADVTFETNVDQVLRKDQSIAFYGFIEHVGTGILTSHKISGASMGTVQNEKLAELNRMKADAFLKNVESAKFGQKIKFDDAIVVIKSARILKKCVRSNALATFSGGEKTIEANNGGYFVEVKVSEKNISHDTGLSASNISGFANIEYQVVSSNGRKLKDSLDIADCVTNTMDVERNQGPPPRLYHDVKSGNSWDFRIFSEVPVEIDKKNVILVMENDGGSKKKYKISLF